MHGIYMCVCVCVCVCEYVDDQYLYYVEVMVEIVGISKVTWEAWNMKREECPKKGTAEKCVLWGRRKRSFSKEDRKEVFKDTRGN